MSVTGLLIALAAAGSCAQPGADAADDGRQADPPPVRACTEIGCHDGLTVRLDPGLGRPRAVEVMGPGEAVQRVECGQEGACGERVFFPGFAADTVRVRVERASGEGGEGGEVVVTLAVSYREVRPNGAGCPPTCRQGEVTIPAQ